MAMTAQMNNSNRARCIGLSFRLDNRSLCNYFLEDKHAWNQHVQSYRFTKIAVRMVLHQPCVNSWDGYTSYTSCSISHGHGFCFNRGEEDEPKIKGEVRAVLQMFEDARITSPLLQYIKSCPH
jgi:hypothetical protein